MFQGHPVVCVTPAGRRRYLRLLAPLVPASPHVDRWDLWRNTADRADLAFLDGLARLDPRVRVVAHPDGLPPGLAALPGFSRLTMEPGTIYVRLDDDVVWADARFFERLLSFRVAHPEHVHVMPLVINNALCSHLLQTFGKLRFSRRVSCACWDRVGWEDPEAALALHRLALGLLERGEEGRLSCGSVPIALNRFSINCISWFGHDMAAAGGVRGADEEEELSNEIPTRLRRTCCFHTEAVVAHFAFCSQRERLDATDLLARYEALLARRTGLEPWFGRVGALLGEVDGVAGGTPWHMPFGREPLRRRLRRWRRRLLGREPAPVRVEAGPCL